MARSDTATISWDILRGPGIEELGNLAKALAELQGQKRCKLTLRFQGARGSSARKSVDFTLTGLIQAGDTGFTMSGILHLGSKDVNVRGYYGPIGREGWLEPDDE